MEVWRAFSRRHWFDFQRDDYGLWQGRSCELSWMEKACSVTVCQNIFIVNLANGPSS